MIENHFLACYGLELAQALAASKGISLDRARRSILPTVTAEKDALRIAAALDSRGTCLSRSVTLAARLRDVEVVIGVDSGSGGGHGAAFTAHAWVEISGAPLRASDVIAGEIVRIRAHDDD